MALEGISRRTAGLDENLFRPADAREPVVNLVTTLVWRHLSDENPLRETAGQPLMEAFAASAIFAGVMPKCS